MAPRIPPQQNIAGQIYDSVFQDDRKLVFKTNYRLVQIKSISTFIKLPFVIKTVVLSIFEWPFYTGFTVLSYEIMISLIPYTFYTWKCMQILNPLYTNKFFYLV